MKQIIKSATTNSEAATKLASRVKSEIEAGNADDKLFKQLALALKSVNKALSDADEDMRQCGEEWRMGDSPTGELVKEVKKTTGYAQAIHDKIMTDRMQLNRMLIRRVSLAGRRRSTSSRNGEKLHGTVEQSSRLCIDVLNMTAGRRRPPRYVVGSALDKKGTEGTARRFSPAAPSAILRPSPQDECKDRSA